MGHRFADHDSDKADDFRDQLLTHVNPPIEEGKDFTFVNNAIGYVQSNLVSVPEPSSFARRHPGVCVRLFPPPAADGSRRFLSTIVKLLP